VPIAKVVVENGFELFRHSGSFIPDAPLVINLKKGSFFLEDFLSFFWEGKTMRSRKYYRPGGKIYPG